MSETYLVCNYLHQPGCICGRTIHELKREIEAMRKVVEAAERQVDAVDALALACGQFGGVASESDDLTQAQQLLNDRLEEYRKPGNKEG